LYDVIACVTVFSLGDVVGALEKGDAGVACVGKGLDPPSPRHQGRDALRRIGKIKNPIESGRRFSPGGDSLVTVVGVDELASIQRGDQVAVAEAPASLVLRRK
jgi:hypothetical protein